MASAPASNVQSKNPSIVSGNMAGTLAGVVATFAVGALGNAGYLALIVAATGMPEATVTLIIMSVVGGMVNYGITHVAVMGTLNKFYTELPTTYAEYPKNPQQPIGNDNNLTFGGK